MLTPRRLTVRSWIIGTLVGVAYCTAYAADVTIGGLMVVDEPGPNEPFYETRIYRSEAYRFGGMFAGILFFPIHCVDRELRPEVWCNYVP
jgi:hypothetical protein